MDYKEKIDLIGWHSLYTKLNGTDAKVLMRFIVEANYKTGEVRFGLGELVGQIGSDKNSISKSIKKLIEQEVLTVVEKGVGTKPTNYKISNIERLNYLFEVDDRNPKQSKWEKDLIEFCGDVISDQGKIERKRSGCQNCKAENEGIGEDDAWSLCVTHLFEQKDFEKSIAYKKYTLWLMDNPEPSFKVRTIKGKIVE